MDMRPGACLWLQVLGLVVLIFLGLARGQGIQTSSYGASSVLRGASGGELELPRPNPFGLPGQALRGADGSGSFFVSNGMLQDLLPVIPNLQFGYFYNFGKDVSSGRATIDYTRPFHLSERSVVFGEAHTEISDFWETFKGSTNNRVDVSLGGGYRHAFSNAALVCINGFYDTSRLGGRWYSSGGLGLQMAAELPGNDALDVNFNWYGNLFQSSVIRNAFRNGPSNYDFQAGYSHELWDGGPDVRLSATGYRFDAGQRAYGANAAAEIKSRDGVFFIRYAVGHDKINRTYQTIGAMVNVGFTPENLLKGESPFSMPQPIFRSPRNLLSWLDSTMSTVRNFSQPASALISQASRTTSVTPLTVTVVVPAIAVGGFRIVFLSTPIQITDLAPYNTLTITLSPGPPNSTPPGTNQVALIPDTGAGPHQDLSPLQTTVVKTRAGNAQWFGVGLPFGGTEFDRIVLNNANGPPSQNWGPVTVTLTWTP
jgi:hypothetical protein